MKFTKEFRAVENLVRFPINVGITGQSIEENKILYYNDGDAMHAFAAKIDNCCNLPRVDSLMIGPVRDKKGELKGVL